VKASFWVSAMASRWLRFIFQLPAMSAVRLDDMREPFVLAMGSVLQNCEAGELLALEILQAGTSTG
jgi:hypothetical protein